MHIKNATVGDIPALVDLNFALFQEDGRQRDPYMNLNWPREEGQEHFGKLISGPGSLCLLADEGDQTVGYLAGYLRAADSLRPVKIAELESMYVLPAYRSQEVGRQLVDAFVAWARQQGAQRASVTAYAANDRAIAFYRRAGFTPLSLSLELGIV
jgi:ribosomal protein S18 acetylase RimI-like enzyme